MATRFVSTCLLSVAAARKDSAMERVEGNMKSERIRVEGWTGLGFALLRAAISKESGEIIMFLSCSVGRALR